MMKESLAKLLNPKASRIFDNFMGRKFNEFKNVRYSLLAMCMYLTLDPL